MRVLLIALLVLLSGSVQAKYGFASESFYSEKICTQEYAGQPTYHEFGNPDCETQFMVFEFDWADGLKPYECHGQAKFYAYHTKKFPVCVLLARTQKEYEKGLKHMPAIIDAGLGFTIIKIWEEQY